MEDRYGRRIDYLRISLTDRCNLRCIYCMPEDGVEKKEHEEILTLEEFLQVAEAAVRMGIKKIRLTGGEPLVRKGIVSFIQKLNEIPGLQEIALTTNGTFLGTMAADLKKAGLKRVNISLDTLREDRYREITRGGKLEEVLAGIRAAKAAGLTPIKMNTVLIRGFNDDEIQDFVRFSESEGVEVRFIELMPIGNCADWAKDHFISAEEILKNYPDWSSEDTSGNNAGPARMYHPKEGTGRIGFINPISHSFCSACNRIRLTADGKVKPCLHSDEEIDLRGILRGKKESVANNGTEGEIDNETDGKPNVKSDRKKVQEELEKALRDTVFRKPEEHSFTEEEKIIERDMYRIGG